MAILVGESFQWHTTGDTWWAHLVADTPEELHAAARLLGLRREWFQAGDGRYPHYDLKGGVLERAQRIHRIGDRRAILETVARCRAAMEGEDVPGT